MTLGLSVGPLLPCRSPAPCVQAGAGRMAGRRRAPARQAQRPHCTAGGQEADKGWDEGQSVAAAIPLPVAAEKEAEQAERVAKESAAKGDNALARFWRAYSNALERNPIAVKSATSFVGFMLGDVIAQLVVGDPFNIMRTLRLVFFGMVMDGPIGHVWYTFLDSKVYPEEPTSNRAVIAKMVVDQLIWAPFFSCIFFTFMNTLEGHPGNIIPTIQAKLIPMMLANYALWPVAHLINFKFIPSSQRILYINCVQIVWSAYLSNLTGARKTQGVPNQAQIQAHMHQWH